MLWWYDSTTTICQQKEFCDLYAYQGLRTFEQRSSCEHSLGHNVITIGDDGNNQAERISVSVMNETDIISNATNPDIRNLAGKGVQTVTISHEGKQLLQFDFDFNESVLNLTEAIFKKSSDAESRSWVVINNLSLTQNESKTLYVDKKIGTDVCVLDREVSSIEEFSNDCSAVDETLFNNCDATGQTIGSYTCTDLGDQFRIEGLSHSAVTEVATTYLEIFDTSDLQAVHEGDLIRFSANYTNLSSSNPINGANCDIWFEDLGWEDMVYVSGTYVYERSYDSGVHSFNVSCSASGYETLQVSDDFEVYAQVTSVPEFNMYGLVLGMLLVATMLTVMRRRLIN
jgi:hypothetical protein